MNYKTLGLGLGMGPEIMQSMAHLRGGNAFGLIGDEDVETFIADEYPWFVAPIAYDLDVGLALPAGLDVATPYGFPVGFADDPRLSAASVFLSKRRGALLVSVAGDAAALDALGGELTLGWTTPNRVAHEARLTVARDGAALDERGQWFAQEAVARTTALALLVEGMHRAAEQYPFSASEASVAAVALVKTRSGRVASTCLLIVVWPAPSSASTAIETFFPAHVCAARSATWPCVSAAGMSKR